MDSMAQNYLDDAIATFKDYKLLAEKAFAQVSDDEFFAALDAEANSIGLIVKHMSGNMLSRWTDFLTSDGEKPDRNRDAEFELVEKATRDEAMQQWERGWACLFEALEPLEPKQLSDKVLIRGQAHTVIEAINRQLTHYAYHIGQIVLLAKHARASEWKFLSIPKGKSQVFNTAMSKGHKSVDSSTRKSSRLAPDSPLYGGTEKL